MSHHQAVHRSQLKTADKINASSRLIGVKNVVRSPFALPTLSRLITPRFIPAGFPQVTALLAKVCRVMTSLPPKRKVSVLTEQRRAHTLRICSPRSYEPIGRVTPPRADFDSTRRRHSGDYAPASSIIPLLRSEFSLHMRSTTTVLLPSRLDLQVSLIEPSPVCKHSRKPFPEDTLASSEVHPKVRLIPRTSCCPTTGLFHRQSGANCAFRSTAFSARYRPSPFPGDFSHERSSWSALVGVSFDPPPYPLDLTARDVFSRTIRSRMFVFSRKRRCR